MRSIEQAHAAITQTTGAHFVNAAAYKHAAAEVGPDATAPQILDRLVKHRVSESVDGSPAFFRRAKRDLDAMVRHLGLPSHFVTITMNETGDMRGIEYECIDGLMHQWNQDFSWRDAPVECNRLVELRRASDAPCICCSCANAASRTFPSEPKLALFAFRL
jgi:hypothetical protein